MNKCEKRCIDCIHCEVCENNSFLVQFDKNDIAYCTTFKDKSLCVEIPVRVGQTIYVIEVCHCYNDNYANGCHKRRTKATKSILTVSLPYKHHPRCAKLFERPFKIEYLAKIGKTVFLTKEEAERKLKEIE